MANLIVEHRRCKVHLQYSRRFNFDDFFASSFFFLLHKRSRAFYTNTARNFISFLICPVDVTDSRNVTVGSYRKFVLFLLLILLLALLMESDTKMVTAKDSQFFFDFFLFLSIFSPQYFISLSLSHIEIFKKLIFYNYDHITGHKLRFSFFFINE